VMLQVEVFWVVIPCSVVVGQQCIFRGWRQHRPPKRRYYTTTLHGIISHTRVYPKVSGLSHNEIYAYNNKHLLRSNTKGCGGETH
jgi:hypothetical protein